MKVHADICYSSNATSASMASPINVTLVTGVPEFGGFPKFEGVPDVGGVPVLGGVSVLEGVPEFGGLRGPSVQSPVTGILQEFQRVKSSISTSIPS